jgi:hypothetical protein
MKNHVLLSGFLIFSLLLVCSTGNVSAEGENADPDLSAQAIVDRPVARAEAQHTGDDGKKHPPAYYKKMDRL